MPAGQSETDQYDANGNMSSKTDFNGKTTTYTYDSMNRLLSKTPDPSFHAPAVTFTYSASGKRASMGDSSGGSSYSYDFFDRLTGRGTFQSGMSYTLDLAGNVTSEGAGQPRKHWLF